MVLDYIKCAVLDVLVPNQYGAVLNSSTTQALIHMLHDLSKETDGNGATVRAIFFDFRKVFDLIDHKILVEKLCSLNLPTRIIHWIIGSLSNRSQRVKLSEDWLFPVLINDLDVDNLANAWKYVDNTTATKVVAKGNRGCAREIVHKVTEWFTQSRVQLDGYKCKELRISFVKDEPQFASIVVDGNELERASSAKLLGLTISSNLTWNEHNSDVIKKATKRLYFSAQLKRARVPLFTQLVYALFLRARHPSFLCPAKVLKDKFVRVEKRAMSTVCPGLPYQEAIEPVNIVPIVDFITGLCGNTFDTIIKVLEHHPNSLISFSGPSRYAPRCKKRFIVPKCKTNRFRNNFIISSCIDNIFTWIFSLFFI